MYKIVLIRHGESVWNKENLFTGWTDVDLSDKGLEEAHTAGKRLKAEGYVFDEAWTSVLKRAIRTLWIALDEMDLMYLPVHNDWRLNERHYGALQGLNKAETAAKYGEEQVKLWRRSYDVPPPALEPDDPRYPGKDPRYAQLGPEQLPRCESLKDTCKRTMPFWEEVILPRLVAGRRMVVSAHGNSLRAIVKSLDGITDTDIVNLNIPTGIPLIYEFNDDLSVHNRFYLADADELARAEAAVAAQGKAKKEILLDASTSGQESGTKPERENQMAVKIDKETCIGCGACVDVCPVSALSMEDGKAKCDESLCIDCGACIATCPVQAISE